MLKRQTTRLKVLILIFSITLLAGSCNLVEQAQAPTVETTEEAPRIFSYDGVEGVDAMTLLKQNYSVETEDFGSGLGEFVKIIEGVVPANDEFWAFYVNGESSNVGASSYVSKEGDVIEWKIDKIGEY